MDLNNIDEHEFKEMLKKQVDNSPNYTEQIKYDLKAIINTSKTPEDLCEAALLYFSALKYVKGQKVF